jgi:hypothetical protein
MFSGSLVSFVGNISLRREVGADDITDDVGTFCLSLDHNLCKRLYLRWMGLSAIVRDLC